MARSTKQFSCGAGAALVAALDLQGNHTMQYSKGAHLTMGNENISFPGSQAGCSASRTVMHQVG